MAEAFQGAAQDPLAPPIPRHKSKHPAPACQPTSQTDVIDAHNMAIIAHLWKMFGKTQAEPHYLLSRGDSTGVLAPVFMAYFPPPPLFGQANSSI
jgi:hypothetical protein